MNWQDLRVIAPRFAGNRVKKRVWLQPTTSCSRLPRVTVKTDRESRNNQDTCNLYCIYISVFFDAFGHGTPHLS